MPETGEPTYSIYGGDPTLSDLVEEFVEGMPDRLDELSRAFESDDIGSLESVGHQIKGAAGGYGFHQQTPYALRVEQFAGQAADRELLQNALEELIQMGNSLRAGTPEKSA